MAEGGCRLARPVDERPEEEQGDAQWPVGVRLEMGSSLLARMAQREVRAEEARIAMEAWLGTAVMAEAVFEAQERSKVLAVEEAAETVARTPPA